MKVFVVLATLAVLLSYTAAAPQDYEDEAEMLKLASRKAEIQSALKQALKQSALNDEDEVNLQEILADAEQYPDDTDLEEAQLMKLSSKHAKPR